MTYSRELGESFPFGACCQEVCCPKESDYCDVKAEIASTRLENGHGLDPRSEKQPRIIWPPWKSSAAKAYPLS